MADTPTDVNVAARIRESIRVKQLLLEDESYLADLRVVGLAMAESLSRGNTLFFMGNGGSAADAQHLAAEFTGRYLLDRRPLPAMALSVNSSSLTAIGNDYSFDVIFARQLEAFAAAGDVVVALSTSGNSRNILCAVEVAKSKQMLTVGLTGQGGGLLKEAVDYCFCIPSKETPRIQESHIMTGHILCEVAENKLFG